MTSTASPSVWDVPGQEQAVAVLRGAVVRDEVAHAWAFTGPPGVGQQRAARGLAAALCCPTPRAPGEPCGACGVCERAARGAHPDLWEFVPAGREHRVADVRETWLPVANRSAAEGGWKVLRVVDADRMNEAAANTFLKGLEEPPARTLWILDVADPDELPDTILSRCRVVRFAPWGPDELDAEAQRLGLADPGERALAVRASLGLPARLRRLAGDGEDGGTPGGGLADLRAHRDVIRALRDEGPGHALVAARAIDDEAKRRTATIKAEGKAERAALAELYGEQPPRGVAKQVDDRLARQEREARTAVVQDALDDLLAWLRDCLLVAAGGDPAAAVHADAPDALRADADALGAARVLRAIDLVGDAREAGELNLQQGLALEALFLELSALALEPVG